jgi:capsular polysaccharide biosynthesis protein
MELRAYGRILRRRWLIALVPALIVLVVGLVTYRPAPDIYNVGVRFEVGQFPAEQALTLSDEQRYYNWLTSEYIVNGLADWINGNRFGVLVSSELARQGVNIPAGTIQSGLAVDNARSMLLVSLTGNNTREVAQMMNAVIVVLTEQNAQALPQLGGEPAILVQLDQPVVNQVPAGLRNTLELPLRLALALAAGLGLAFLAEYLDPTVRERSELKKMDLPVLGVIPKK